MISTTVRYTPTNLTQIISDLPRNMRGAACEEAAKYLIGTPTRGLMHYPMYSHVTRASAYGQTFQSDRQRRWFFAALNRGEILPGFPRRTGRTQRGWHTVGSGVSIRIVNAEPGAYYTVGDPGQARLNEKAGWKRVGLIIASNQNGMIHAVDLRIARELREKGL